MDGSFDAGRAPKRGAARPTIKDDQPRRPRPRLRLDALSSTERFRARRTFIDDDGHTFRRLAHAPGPLTPSPQRIAAFLKLGYVPGHATLFEEVDCLPGGCRITVDDEGEWSVAGRFRYRDLLQRGAWWDTPFDLLAREAARRFSEAVARRHDPKADIVVPLGGGIASRAVLGALLELRPASRIHTYTFGTPGTKDFQLGNAVARHAGTRHTVYDLTKLSITTERLVRAAKLSDANTDLFQPVLWTWIADDFGDEVELWTDFCGDGIGGSHYVPWRTASRLRLVDDFVRGASGAHHWFGPEAPHLRWDELLDDGAMYVDAISDGEALWWANHAERHAAHQLFMNGLRYENPFTDDDLTAFFFSVDPRFRRDESLFDAAMIGRFPELFALPTTSGLHRGSVPQKVAWGACEIARKIGWRITPEAVPHPDASYVDYAHRIGVRDDLRRCVRENVEDLKARQLLDPGRIDRIWREHEAGADRAYTLTLLASLEASLKAMTS